MRLNKVGVIRASFNFINSVLGIGILSIPLSIERTGVILGVFLIAFVTLISIYVSIELVSVAKLKNTNKFQILGEKSGGKPLFYATLIMCILFPVGALMNYVIIVLKSSKYLLQIYIYKNNEKEIIWVPVIITICIYGLIVTPLSLMTDMKKLSFFSMASVIVFTIIFILMWGAGSQIDYDKKFYLQQNVQKTEITDFFSAVGALGYSIVSTDSIFPIYNTLENQSQENWNKVSILSFGFLGFLYACFSLICVYFIPNIKGNVLNSPSISNSILISIGRILLTITVILTFPVVVHIMRCYIYYLLETFHRPINEMDRKIWLMEHVLITVLIVFLSILGALKIGRFKVIVDVTGLLTGMGIGFVLPVIVIFKAKSFRAIWDGFKDSFRRKKSLKIRFLGIFNLFFPAFVLIFGLFSFFVGTPIRIKQFIDDKK